LLQVILISGTDYWTTTRRSGSSCRLSAGLQRVKLRRVPILWAPNGLDVNWDP